MKVEHLILDIEDNIGNIQKIQCEKALGEGLSGLICLANYNNEEIAVKFYGLTGDGEQIHVKSSISNADINEENHFELTKPYNNMSDFLLENSVLEHAKNCKIVPEKKFSSILILRNKAIPFIGSEFVKGKSVKQLVSGKEKVSLKEKLIIMGNLLKGVHELHLLGIVNRDIKSAHVIVNSINDIKLLDYGASSLKGKTSSNKSEFKTINHEYNQGAWQIFTPWFLDPYRSKKAKPSNDIYSIGIVFGEFITETLMSSVMSMDNILMVARGKTLHGLSKYVRKPMYEKLNKFENKGKIEKQVSKLIKSHFKHPILRPNAEQLSLKCFQLASNI